MTKKEKKLDENAEENKTYTQEDIDAYQTALNDAQAVAEQYLEDLQRERASFANYKRRIDQDNLMVAEMNSAKASTSFYRSSMTLNARLKIAPKAWNATLGSMALSSSCKNCAIPWQNIMLRLWISNPGTILTLTSRKP